jgi:hypothetical protein
MTIAQCLLKADIRFYRDWSNNMAKVVVTPSRPFLQPGDETHDAILKAFSAGHPFTFFDPLLKCFNIYNLRNYYAVSSFASEYRKIRANHTTASFHFIDDRIRMNIPEDQVSHIASKVKDAIASNGVISVTNGSDQTLILNAAKISWIELNSPNERV